MTSTSGEGLALPASERLQNAAKFVVLEAIKAGCNVEQDLFADEATADATINDMLELAGLDYALSGPHSNDVVFRYAGRKLQAPEKIDLWARRMVYSAVGQVLTENR